MRFYHRLAPIKAISFDLDDTLYSNKPIMQAIEKKMIAYFAEVLNQASSHFPSLMTGSMPVLNHHFWLPFRQLAIKNQPDLIHDVVIVRLVTYQLGFQSLGVDESLSQQMAQSALKFFVKLRSDFIVPQSSHDLLKKLSQHYPLVSISNGNVDTDKIGISPYFKHIYHAGWQKDKRLFKQKPAQDMFALACQQLAIEPQQLLHVGDCGRADIQGARLAGCQTAWLSCYSVGKKLSVLPDIELSDIAQLAKITL